MNGRTIQMGVVPGKYTAVLLLYTRGTKSWCDVSSQQNFSHSLLYANPLEKHAMDLTRIRGRSGGRYRVCIVCIMSLQSILMDTYHMYLLSTHFGTCMRVLHHQPAESHRSKWQFHIFCLRLPPTFFCGASINSYREGLVAPLPRRHSRVECRRVLLMKYLLQYIWCAFTKNPSARVTSPSSELAT